VQGVNFPLLSIYEEERLILAIRPNPSRVELDRALGNRYRHVIRFSHLYIDLDDTLILNGVVNLDAIRLVFKCVNEGKKVTLVTRHAGDLEQTLARHRLSGAFDEIIHLRKQEKKSAYIARQDAIYVDDSFAERKDVEQVCGIPTFDCSMIELLNNGTSEN
jgi:carbamoyl-phosphate synthase large subunit